MNAPYKYGGGGPYIALRKLSATQEKKILDLSFQNRQIMLHGTPDYVNIDPEIIMDQN